MRSSDKVRKAVATMRLKLFSVESIAGIMGWTGTATRTRIKKWRRDYPDEFPHLDPDRPVITI